VAAPPLASSELVRGTHSPQLLHSGRIGCGCSKYELAYHQIW